MRKLINTKTVVADGKATITGDVVDAAPADFVYPVQHTTVGYLHPTNPRQPRHVQISSQGVFVKRREHGGMIPLEDLASIMLAIEPKTAGIPFIRVHPTPQSLIVNATSQIDCTYQWKMSDTPDPKGKWSDIAGQTTVKLERTDALKGKWVSCVVTNGSGAIASKPIQI